MKYISNISLVKKRSLNQEEVGKEREDFLELCREALVFSFSKKRIESKIFFRFISEDQVFTSKADFVVKQPSSLILVTAGEKLTLSLYERMLVNSKLARALYPEKGVRELFLLEEEPLHILMDNLEAPYYVGFTRPGYYIIRRTSTPWG